MTPSCCVLSSPAAFLGLAAHSEDVKIYVHFTKYIVRNSLPLLSTTTNQPTNNNSQSRPPPLLHNNNNRTVTCSDQMVNLDGETLLTGLSSSGLNSAAYSTTVSGLFFTV
jgi:hypothetical protein